MTPERWQQIKEVLATALEAPLTERARYLEQSCKGDDSLQMEVERLLQRELEVGEEFLHQNELATAAAAVLPGEENPCVKVTFPCYGSSSVYLRPEARADGSFGLKSNGAGFGRAGFYRVLESGKDAWRVRNFKTLHEVFHVYVDEDGVLRTDHTITFVGLKILQLHYKMTRRQQRR